MARIKALPSRLQAAPQRAAVAVGSWRAGKEGSTARGYDRRWRAYRLQYLAEHPLCVKCKARDLITASSVVDHIVPHRGDERLFRDPNNHQALCETCHDSDKAREERAAGFR